MALIRPGDLIANRYRILRRLGAGGFGVVFLVQDETIARQVALKILRTDTSTEMALREARVAGRLVHPNIVTIFDVGSINEDVFLAMEYIDGQPLDEYMSPDVLSLEERLKLIVQLCRGLAAAHEARVIHRDIKPTNLLVDRHLRLKIVDFGMARAADTASVVKSGHIAGSLEYMAPEQLLASAIDHRVDIFSATAVAYELLSGVRAYPGGMTSAYRRLQGTEVPPLPERLGELGPQLDAVIRRGLDMDPAKRHESAKQLGDAIEAVRLRAERAEKTAQVGAALQRPLPPPEPVPRTNPIEPASAQVPRAWLFAGAAIALALAVTFALRPNGKDSTPPPREVQVGNTGASPAGSPASTVAGPATPTGPGASPRRPPEKTERPRSAAAASSPTSSTGVSVPPLSAPPTVEDVNDPPGAGADPAVPGTSPADEEPTAEAAGVSVRGVLDAVNAYARAHENRSSATLKLLQPTLTVAQLAALDRTFAENDPYQFRVSAVSVSVSGAQARVDCTVTRVLSQGGQRREIARPAAFDLARRDDGGWSITNFRVAP